MDTGYSEFVFLIDDASKAEFEIAADRFQSIADVISEYDIITKEHHYWLIQLEVMFSNRSKQELCKFVTTYFPFIAMRQGKSTYILVNDHDVFKNMLTDIYDKERKLYFLYDMLTVEERYEAALHTGVEINPYSDNRLVHNENGAIYSLVFGRECIYLFTSEPEISVMDSSTGEYKELDITDGLGIYKFHIAILK